METTLRGFKNVFGVYFAAYSYVPHDFAAAIVRLGGVAVNVGA